VPQGTGVSGQTLTFVVNGQTLAALTNAQGVATTAVVFPSVGTFPVVVTFAGNGASYLLASSGSGSVQVSQKTQVVYVGLPLAEAGFPVPMLAFLRAVPQGTPIAGEPITFTIGATTRTVVTNAFGVALAAPSLEAGSYSVQVSFGGDVSRALLPASASGSLRVIETRRGGHR
jgi:hypothetical protein